MSSATFLNKKIIITQVKSGSKLNNRQRGNIIGLGLRGIGSFSIITCDKAALGMIKKINHIIKISLT
jgi:ribosomal protein L30/L7E